MRARGVVPAALVLWAALTGCGGNGTSATPTAQPGESADTDVATSSVDASAEDGVARTTAPPAPAPEASASTDSPAGSAPEPTTGEETTAEPTPEESTPPAHEDLDLTQGAVPVADVDFGETTTNAHGDTVQEVGQWVGINSADQELLVAAFRVTDIEVDVECTDNAEPPQNGHYIAVTLEVQVSPEFADQAVHGFSETVWFNPGTMLIFDGADELEMDSSGRGSTCLPLSEHLTPELAPGEQDQGVLVLDSAVESGDLVIPQILMFPDTLDTWAWSF